MKFDRLRLRNFKSFEDADLSLDTGVSVIHGMNGSGKSSLLEACFFALYGSTALDSTLDEVVTTGCEEMAVELWFTHGGQHYHLEREVVLRDETARTITCVLEEPELVTEGATDVKSRITTLFRMDDEAFVNCAYVRQGEVNKLINASPSDRQDILDDLLQLGTLERYRDRASETRIGVGRVLEDKQGALNELEKQITEKQSKELHESLNHTRSELTEVETTLEQVRENRQNARETVEQANQILEEYESTRETLDSLEEQIEDLTDRIESTAQEREELAEQLQAKQDTLETVTERRDELLGTVDLPDVSDLESAVDQSLTETRSEIDEMTDQIKDLSVTKQEHDGKQEQHETRANELESSASENREQATALEAELDAERKNLETKRSEFEAMTETLAEKRDALEESPVDPGNAETYQQAVRNDLSTHREMRAECSTALENARERVSEARDLLDAGKCPTCGQPVSDSPHVDALGERESRVEALKSRLETIESRIGWLEELRTEATEYVELDADIERLKQERETITQLLDEKETTLGEKADRIDSLREEAAEYEHKATEARERAAEAAEAANTCRERIASLNEQKQRLTKRQETLEELATCLDRLGELEAERTRLQEQRSERADRNDERRERLAELRDRRDELRESIDESRIEAATEKRAEGREYIEQADEQIDALESKRSTFKERIGALENELEELETLQSRRESLESNVEQLESLHGEIEQLEQLYMDLRAQLRRQNVETLERMLNETFDLIFQNDTYDRLELDGDYELSIRQKDGKPLEPEQLSGGERALFNLSLRCAIYRLLAEGIEGTAPMPPLILDEPTVFLDAGHVTQLLELIGAMYELGVEQILVVSHDDELVSAADVVIRVTKDSTTNRSSIDQSYTEPIPEPQ